MSETIHGVIRNARFLDIGSNRIVVAGNIYDRAGVSDGSTFYSDPVKTIIDDVAQTESENFRFSRKIQ